MIDLNEYIDFRMADELRGILDMEHTEETGTNRLGYSDAENRAIDATIKQIHELQKIDPYIRCYSDLMGNIYIVKPGANPDAKAILMGSHLDSVPNGGRFDGADGVIASIACLSGLVKTGTTLENDFVSVIWRCEESPMFNQVSVGAKGSAGDLLGSRLAELEARAPHPHAGQKFTDVLQATLQHLIAEGFTVIDSELMNTNDPEILTRKLVEKLVAGTDEALLNLDSIKEVIEVHIEQGEQIAENGAEVGIATAIRGNTRHRDVKFCGQENTAKQYRNTFEFDLTFRGEANHSGSTPQHKRQDAIARAMAYITSLEEYFATDFGKFGIELVDIKQENGSATTIPDHLNIRFIVGVNDNVDMDGLCPQIGPNVELNEKGPVLDATPIKHSTNFLAAARFLNDLNQTHQEEAECCDLVWTAPLVSRGQDGSIKMALEVRSTDQEALDDERELIEKTWNQISHEYEVVTVDFGEQTIAKPGKLKSAPLLKAAERTKIPALKMISGAGHDCAVFAAKGIATMLLFIKQDVGLSHDPAEYRTDDDFETATRIIMQHLLSHKSNTTTEIGRQLSRFELGLIDRCAMAYYHQR